MEQEKKQRGGKRPGAGRKTSDKKTLSINITLSPEAQQCITAVEKGKLSAYISNAIVFYSHHL